MTGAEREVFELILLGLGNADIATARGSRMRTVANQVRSVLAKLGCSSRSEVATRYGACSAQLRRKA